MESYTCEKCGVSIVKGLVWWHIGKVAKPFHRECLNEYLHPDS